MRTAFLLALIAATNVTSAQPAGISTAGKTTGSNLRLVAQSSYLGTNNGSFAPVDSTRFVYPDNISTACTESHLYLCPAGSWQYNRKSEYTYLPMSSLLMMRTDRQWNSSAAAYSNYAQDLFVHDPNDDCTERLTNLWDVALSGYVATLHVTNTFNNYHQVIDSVQQFRNAQTSSLQNFRRTLISYNGQHCMLTLLNKQWNTGQGIWVNDELYTYNYDPSGNHLTADTFSTWNSSGSSWMKANYTTYTLDAAGRPLTAVYYKRSASNGWDLLGKALYTYDAQGNLITRVYQQYVPATASFGNRFREDITYNGAGLKTSYTLLNWVSGAWTINEDGIRDNYYYSPYNPSGLEAVPDAGPVLTLAPVPASDDFRLQLSWIKAQKGTGSLTDSRGNRYLQFAIPFGKDFETTLSVREVPAGNYLLTILGDNDGKVTRMVMVTH